MIRRGKRAIDRRSIHQRLQSKQHTIVLLMCFAGWLLPHALWAQESSIDKPGRTLKVCVDPRVELLSIIFRLAGNPEYNQGKVDSYTSDVEKHFALYRNHPVVDLAGRLRKTRGVSYDACMSMAVHVTDAFSLNEKTPFDPHPATLDGRWTVQQAREFLKAARHFVTESDFKTFIQRHEHFYETSVSRMESLLLKEGHLEWFDQFFGARPGAGFTLALGMLNGGACYGARIRLADGKEQLYCILGVWATDAKGLPRFDRNMLPTVVHEFCHSYTNSLVDKHEAQLKHAGETIFPHVEPAMTRQAYSNWKTMMYESLVRACVVRYTHTYEGADAAARAIRQEQRRQFLWMKELSDLLGEYEADRKRYATLDSFFPRIASFFDDYAVDFAKRQGALQSKLPKIVSLIPANEADDVDPDLEAIKITFDRPMQDRMWAVVGGGTHFPEITGDISYDSARKILTVPVKLKPNWSYEFYLNSDTFQTFRSAEGFVLKPVHVTFKTAGSR